MYLDLDENQEGFTGLLEDEEALRFQMKKMYGIVNLQLT